MKPEDLRGEAVANAGPQAASGLGRALFRCNPVGPDLRKDGKGIRLSKERIPGSVLHRNWICSSEA